MHLSKNQRFAEAQRWFHYVFDPTSTDPTSPAPQRFWKFLRVPPGDDPAVRSTRCSRRSPTAGDSDGRTARSRRRSRQWRDNPFQPHVIARGRDRRLPDERGDEVPRQPHRLGRLACSARTRSRRSTRRPSSTCSPRTSSVPSRSRCRRAASDRRAELRAAQGRRHRRVRQRAGRARERVPVRLAPAPARRRPRSDRRRRGVRHRPLAVLLRPAERPAARLLGHASRDRLFKIRHCMNIEGVVRQLAAVRPADRPGRARQGRGRRARHRRASSNGLNQPVSTVRGPLLLQKALELCSEVKSLGAAHADRDREGRRRAPRAAAPAARAGHAATSPATCASCSGRRPRRRPRRSLAQPRDRVGALPPLQEDPRHDRRRHRRRSKPSTSLRTDLSEETLRRGVRRARRRSTRRSLARGLPQGDVGRRPDGVRRQRRRRASSAAKLGQTLPLNKNENAELNIFLPTSDTFGDDRHGASTSPRRSSRSSRSSARARQPRSVSAATVDVRWRASCRRPRSTAARARR